MAIKGRPRLDKLIKDMLVGESGFISTDALAFDLKVNPYLCLFMNVYSRRSPNTKIPIRRTGQGLADYDVDLRKIKYRWGLESKPFSDIDDFEYLEIVKLDYESLADTKKAQIFEASRHKHPKTYKLRRQINEAIRREDYESASKLRDQINRTREPL